MKQSPTCPECNAKSYEHQKDGNRQRWKYECGSTLERGEYISIMNNNCRPVAVETQGQPSEIDIAISQESAAFSKNLIFLEDRIDLIYDAIEAYKSLFNELKSVDRIKSFGQVLLLQACITSRQELVKGFLSLLRGQHYDTYGNTRRAIECAFFAARSIEKESTGVKWFNAGNSEKDWNKYNDDFKIHYLLKAENAWQKLAHLKPIFSVLAKEYNTLSRFIHTSIYTTGLDTVFGELPMLRFHDNYTVFEDRADVLKEYSWLLKAHADNLDCLIELTKFTEITISEESSDFFKALNKDIIGFFESLPHRPGVLDGME